MHQLSNYPILDQIDPTELDNILPFVTEQQYTDGAIILHEGQISDQFYIVIEGKLDVILEKKLKVHVAKLERGHFFGEMSCLSGEPVSATIQAAGSASVIKMSKEGLLQLMDHSSPFRKQMIDAFIKRLNESNTRVMEEHAKSYVALQQLEQERQSKHGSLVGSSSFMKELLPQIQTLAQQNGNVCLIGEQGVGKFHVAYEIHHQSPQHNQPLVHVSGKDIQVHEWELKVQAAKGGSLVIEHANLISPQMLQHFSEIAVDNHTRLLLTTEKPIHFAAAQLHLIPLRERAEDIPELAQELLRRTGAMNPEELISQEAMRMLSIFPFLKGNIEELERVIREAAVLSGGKTIRNAHIRFGTMREPGARPVIGLALGSGSVRGAAHVGVIKVLEEEGIPIDLIAGSSVGAFIGALYAGGQPVSAFEKVLPQVRWTQLLQFMLPPLAFAKNDPMIRFVEKYIGQVNFNELSIPFAAVASDALTGEAVILNKGRVSHAIPASTAIPGVIKPVRYKQRQLMDGGVVHPVPAALAKSMGADIVIAVNVSNPSHLKKSPKNFVSTILNTIDIMSQRILDEELQLADVVLHPHLDINHITFKGSSAYIQAGEKVTRDALSLIKEKVFT